MVANQSGTPLRRVISLPATQTSRVYCVAGRWRFKAWLTREGLLAMAITQ